MRIGKVSKSSKVPELLSSAQSPCWIRISKDENMLLIEILHISVAIIGVKKVAVLNSQEFVVEPQKKENLFLKIMTLLKTKNIEIDGIIQHQGKAEEVFRELTLNKRL